MGLTLHLQLELPKKLAGRAVETLVRAVHAKAEKLVTRRALDRISAVVPAEGVISCLRWVTVETGPNESTGYEVAPLEGWAFAVAPGRGCESACFGLCRYPATFTLPNGKRRSTGAKPGWSFLGSCKTQYAAMHGWDHFLRCHQAVIDLALLWETMGVVVVLSDEGLYWPDRDERALRTQLALYDRSIAAMAGALKDAAEPTGGTVQAAIFEHPHFERLEAEGAETVGNAVEVVREEVKRARRGRARGRPRPQDK